MVFDERNVILVHVFTEDFVSKFLALFKPDYTILGHPLLTLGDAVGSSFWSVSLFISS
jgi:hypothetical protein